MVISDKTHISHNAQDLLEHFKSCLKPKIVKPSLIEIELEKEQGCIIESEKGWIREDEYSLIKNELTEMDLRDVISMEIKYQNREDKHIATYKFS